MNGYAILGALHTEAVGAVPPYQVIQQMNAGVPPGGIPPWYTMQYPAGYVPPLLISVDNPLEPDPFDQFITLDDREWSDLSRSKYYLNGDVVGEAPAPYDVATIVRAFNAIFFRKEGGKLLRRDVPIAACSSIANMAKTAIDRAIDVAPKGAFIPVQNTTRNAVRGKIQWHLDNIANLLKTQPSTAMYPSADDLREWSTRAFVECNAASSAAEYVRDNLSFYREVCGQLDLIKVTFLDTLDQAASQGIASIVPWWLWLLGGVAVIGVGGYFLLPIVVPALARTAALTKAARSSLQEIR